MAADEKYAGWRWSIVQVNSGCGGFGVTFICNGKRLVVDFLPADSGEGTIGRRLIDRYEAAFPDDDEEMDAVQEEIGDLICGSKRMPIIARLAPPLAQGAQPNDLHSLIYPETLVFHFVTINDEGTLEQNLDLEPDNPPLPWRINDSLGLPTYSSKDIEVLLQYKSEGEIAQVLVDGYEMCYKHAESINRQAVEREFNCLQKIAQSQHASSLRVPKLTGLVTSADNGQMIGILEEHIPNNKYGELVTLRDVDASVVAHSRRKKWAAQIRKMVDHLHEIGVVWGDGKPANVLVHRDTDDAWLIDFGGSWTEGWVDAGLMETEEGDEQAVEKIVKFLDV